ncbi:aldolase catalytic domain-containing protein [Clostridium sp. YB-6]|uniref:Aldolase catalytic domain-containing protein n=1 Tax=Clostridium weizhouense TaxID=2859781 RepID=A0ABS7ALR8_9CLOT|nr:aldolase catalytic domain-containing protein [Clostridium weizhouense]
MEKDYNEEVKVIDCTIRDGGLVNNFYFKDELVKNVYSSCREAKIDYMEIGYKASEEYFSYKEFGKWKFCKEEDIRNVVGESKSGTKLSIMADVGRTNFNELLPKNKSIIDMIRVAAYIHQIEEACEIIKNISDKGYETSLNLMAVSLLKERELNNALEKISKSKVNVVYIVDSFGALYTDDIKDLTNKYLKYIKSSGIKLGIHAHNNRQMAYANSIEALKNGATFVDATMYGLGRGAGNCYMELMLGYLNSQKYSIRPVIQCIQDNILPLKEKIKWGQDISYMLTGQYNIHPKCAIDFLKDENHVKKYLEFFDGVKKY